MPILTLKKAKEFRPRIRPKLLLIKGFEAEGTGLEPATPVKGHLISSQSRELPKPKGGTQLPPHDKLGCTPGCTNCPETGLGSPAGDASAPTPRDPDLTAVVAAWPTLLGPIKAAILALIESAGRS